MKLKKYNDFTTENFADDILSKANPDKPIICSDLVGKTYDENVGYSYLPNLEIVHAVEFVSNGDEENAFSAFYNAENYLKDMGYKIGSMEGPNPIGFSNSATYISKWCNMTSKEHQNLDGAMISDNFRTGSVTILWFTPPIY